MSNTLFLSIVHKAASTQPISRVISQQEASFCDAPEHFLVVSFLTLSPHLGEGGWKGTLQTPQCRRCPPPSPHTPALSSTSWAASRTHVHTPFSLPLFLQTSDLGTAALSILPHSGPICAVLREGMVQLHRTPSGTTRPWLYRFLPGLNPTSGTGCQVAEHRGFPGGTGRDGSLAWFQLG